MARPLRIERPSAWYHITARGNERQAIYRDDQDRYHFLTLLDQAADTFNVLVHAYVLMDNHYHLIVELKEANLSRAMQWLNLSYSMWFNRRRRRCGHLFQGRFKAVIVDRREWGLELSRYVHLNPVRVRRLGLDKKRQQQVRAGAGGKPDPALVHERVAALRAYKWSSYRAYAGLAAIPRWLETRSILQLGGGRKDECRRNYRRYVEQAVREGLEASPWEQVKEQVILGGQEFLAGLREQLKGDDREQRALKRLRDDRPPIEKVIRCVEKVKKARWEDFRDRHGDSGRDLVLHFGRTYCGLKLVELAKAVGLREYMPVAMALKRFQTKLTKAGPCQTEWKQVNQMLTC